MARRAWRWQGCLARLTYFYRQLPQAQRVRSGPHIGRSHGRRVVHIAVGRSGRFPLAHADHIRPSPPRTSPSIIIPTMMMKVQPTQPLPVLTPRRAR